MSGGHFELRRLEQLSNTVFGVAMTLLAYQAPREKFNSPDPLWREIWHLYGAYFSALLLSFIIAGMFWYSHQRRLTYATHGSRPEVLVNLLFLLSIILLPVTCGLFGNNYDSRNVTTLYGLNLFLIAAFNTLLWAMAVAPRRDWWSLTTPLFAFAAFAIALLTSLIDPLWPRYIWNLAFLSPIIAAYVERKAQKRASARP
jgi:uncharacterized membrane protein